MMMLLLCLEEKNAKEMTKMELKAAEMKCEVLKCQIFLTSSEPHESK